MKKLWYTFCQVVTATLGVLFVLSLFKPEWLPGRSKDVVMVKEASGPAITQVTSREARMVSFSEAAKKALPSVVNISIRKEDKLPKNHPLNDPRLRRFFGNPNPESQRSLGSGVVASKDGYLLTNFHVVDGANQIDVFLADGRVVPAKTVGTDPETDLAVLKVDAPNLVPITFAKSDESRVGDVVLAIGDPYGVGQTVTMGIISAVGKSIKDSDYVDFIQTDAAINPGNSGGALIDINGNLLGINSLIYSESGGSQGIGFAVPAGLARNVMEQLIERGNVTRGYFGVRTIDLDPELAKDLQLPLTTGPIVREVVRGSPAERGGIQPLDVVLAINGKAVANQSATTKAISELRPGETANVRVQRGTEEMELKVLVGERTRFQRK